MAQRDDGLAILLFVLVMGGAVALAIASDITSPACSAAAKVVSTGPFDFGCFEFWFNRYQTTFVGIVAAGIAVLAISPALRQVAEAYRQGDGLIRTVIAERIRELQEEKTAVTLLTPYAYAAANLIDLQAPNERRSQGNLSYAHQLQTTGANIAQSVGTIERFAERDIDDHSMNITRRRIIGYANILQKSCETLAGYYIRHLQFGTIKEEVFRKREEKILETSQDMTKSLAVFGDDLTAAIQSNWREVRNLEASIMAKRKSG